MERIMTIATLIVDDEPPARRRLAALLQAVAGFVQVGEARDGLEAVLAIQELRPDLVLLDVQLPGLDGVEVLRTVGVDRAPAVVFVTAFDTFAVEAFAVEAVDYLVKPVDADRFRSALTRVARRLIPGSRSQPGDAHAPIDRLLGRVLPPRPHLDSLVVRAGTEVEQIPVHSVERLRAAGNYVEVFASGRSHLIRDTLAHLQAQLDPSRFVRVHRGEVVALEAIREVLPSATGDAVLVLASGATVRMSRRFADERVRPA
jgi:two-component system LytT family response regulator